MAVNWFPGHMNKARRKIKEAMGDIDVVIEVLDARLPYSSLNPLVDELRAAKPCIKVLNKADLADPNTTQHWLNYFDEQLNTKAMALVAEQRKDAQRVIQLCRKMGAARTERKQAIRVMIMGIPNVGKSTLINALANRNVAQTGNEPAVTKRNQMIDLKNGVVLSDTPGILWPRFENEASGYRLAVSGAIKDTAIEYLDIAQFALDFLLVHYPKALSARFKLDTLPKDSKEALDIIGRKRGCLRAGGVVDIHKAAEIVLHEWRAGKIGRSSLETHTMIEQELAQLAEQQAAEQAKRKEEDAPNVQRGGNHDENNRA